MEQFDLWRLGDRRVRVCVRVRGKPVSCRFRAV